MAKSRPVSLQTFVYRTLSLRIAAMAVFIALATIVTVYIVEDQDLRYLAIDKARAEVQLLVMRTLQKMQESGGDQRAAFRQVLNERISVPLGRESGGFVYVSFHSIDKGDREERRESSYALIDAVQEFVHRQPLTGIETAAKAEGVNFGGKLHVHVVLPIEYQGETVGVAQAVFAPSDEVLLAMKKRLQRSVILTTMIVLITSGLLYPVILHLVRKLVVFSRNLIDANLESLSILASAIAKRDSDTDVHNFRVTLYSVCLAEALDLANSEIQCLIKGAFLHDVGKIGVRDEILHKPGGLEPEEFNLMKEHVRHGLDIVGGSIWLNDAKQIVGSHHEKYDGSGYPEGKSGEEIPLLARIFAIADVFDALTSRRPYKEPLSYEASVALLRQGQGQHFDPGILEVFMSISRELYENYAGRDDQGLRDELKEVITRYFSEGEILQY